jgi:hypothetical protein
VFAGQVLDVGRSTGRGVVSVRMRVDRVWKGDIGADLLLTTDLSDCGFEFRSGEQYIVYASATGEQLTTTVCHRTHVLADAASDLKYLGRGTAP